MRYFYDLPPWQRLLCLKWNSDKLSVYSRLLLAKEKGEKVQYYSGYRNVFIDSQAEETSMDKRMKLQFQNGDNQTEFSDLNMTSLDKIVALCREKEIELIILNTPIHTYYKRKIPEDYINKFKNIQKKHTLATVNFSDLYFSDDCFISDGDHVSAKGARIVTNYFRKRIKLMS